ncbi:hypothetical protein QI305_12155 [Staphylococcus saprophyticus]|nr:hypothetical protein [Staphylococcus saprophyticus]
MKERIETKDLSKENKQIIDRIERDKKKVFILPILCMILMFFELLLDVFMNINTFILIIITWFFSAIINIYVLYKLQRTKELFSTVLTAQYNKLNVSELYNLEEKQLESIKGVKVNWRNFISEYSMIIISIYMCVSIPFVSFIKHFM